MKKIETMIIEKMLLASCYGSNPKLAKEYGTIEVTLSEYGITNGKEIVDFLSYDSKTNIFRCFEIKVTMQDFRSDAKKSWYGNHNYLVLSSDLYEKQSLEKWKQEIPTNVGIIVCNPATLYKEVVKKSKKIDISQKQQELLKNSLLRTLFYQNQNDMFYLRK